MGIFKLLILCAGVFACFSGRADTYERGDASCDSFSKVKREYDKDPDDYLSQADYGLCLIAAYRDEEGVAHLKSAGDKGDILAVFRLARHYRTGGTWDSQYIEPENIQKAIDLYLRVTQMIDDYHGYPVGDMHTVEREYSIEMSSHYRVTSLYYSKFRNGSYGAQSYRNNDNQEGEETYPQYREHTIDSLQKVIHYADICLAVQRENYFDESKYDQYQSACRVFKTAAEALLNPPDLNADQEGLNTQRIRWVNEPTCYRDLTNCKPYQEVMDKIKAIIRTSDEQMAEVWNSG